MYKETSAAVNINGYLTVLFPSIIGVKQGDVLSPTLFSILLNDIADAIKGTSIGVHCGDDLYADVIVILTETENDLI